MHAASHTCRETIIAAASCHLPNEVIEAYAHSGEFILVKTDAERAEQAMEILRECGATRVNRHD
jgi:hypothetical protein